MWKPSRSRTTRMSHRRSNSSGIRAPIRSARSRPQIASCVHVLHVAAARHLGDPRSRWATGAQVRSMRTLNRTASPGNGEQHTDVDSSRAVDDGQRRQGVGQGDPRQPVLRAGRLLRMVREQGRRRRRRARRGGAGRRCRDERRRRPAPIATRLRRLQPDVAVGRRARPHPRGRGQRRHDRRVHQRGAPRARA